MRSDMETGPTQRKRRALAVNIAVAVCSTLLCLLAIEIGLRGVHRFQAPATLEDLEKFRRRYKGRRVPGPGALVRRSDNPRLIYELIPNLDASIGRMRVRTNSMGLRDDEVAPRKPAGTIRIAALGDSVTFGCEVSAGETWPEALEAVLNEHSRGPRFEVVNFGVFAYNSAMEREVLVRKALPLEPDVVVLQFQINDTDQPAFVHERESFWRLDRCYLARFLATRRLRWTGEESAETSAPAGLLGARVVRNDSGTPNFDIDPDRLTPTLRAMVGDENCRNAIRDMGRICRDRRIPAVFLLDPEFIGEYAASGTLTTDPLHAPFVQAACESGFVIADPTSAIRTFLRERGKTGRDLWVDPVNHDSHPAPPRMTLMAMAAARAILDRGMLPPDAIDPGDREKIMDGFRRRAASQWTLLGRDMPTTTGAWQALFPGPSEQLNAFMASGWGPVEFKETGEIFRWTETTARLLLPPSRRLLLDVSRLYPGWLGPEYQQFLLDGKPLAYTITPRGTDRAWLELDIPPDAPRTADGLIAITLRCAPMPITPEQPRDLGLLVFWVLFEPEAAAR